MNEKSRTWAKDRSVKLNQPIQSTNRYTPLDNMFTINEDTTEMLVNGVPAKKTTKSASLRKTTVNGMFRKKIKEKKIIVVGDSHARGLAAELSVYLEKSFEVMGTIMPGSGLNRIIGLASREISQLQRDDFVIIFGGANDINKNESKIGLHNIRKIALQNKYTNIITISPPHRHDLQASSCINGEIQVYNRRLHKILKDMNHVTMIDTNCTREEFTWHGVHMNSAGKEKLARNIVRVITRSLTAQTSSIILNWEEASSIIPNKEASVQPSMESADDEHKTVI